MFEFPTFASSSDALGSSAYVMPDCSQGSRISLAEAIESPSSSTQCSETSSQAPVLLSLAHILDPVDSSRPVRCDQSDCSTRSSATTCITLADILEPVTPAAQSSPAVSESADGCMRGDRTITLALAEELPELERQPSLTGEDGARCIRPSNAKAISLLDAVSLMASRVPCNVEAPQLAAPFMPQCLRLAEHLDGDDPCDVLEDFLATPLPFVGAVA